MSPETFIQQQAARAIQALYGAEVPESALQVSVTRKEFEGDYTLVTFPLLKISHAAPDATGNAIGQWLVDNVPEISAFNSVKGFLNLSFSPVYWNESLQAMASEESFGMVLAAAIENGFTSRKLFVPSGVSNSTKNSRSTSCVVSFSLNWMMPSTRPALNWSRLIRRLFLRLFTRSLIPARSKPSVKRIV